MEGHQFPLIYHALVVENKDPRDIGRVKVRIPGVYPDKTETGEDIEIGDLPWAIPALSLFNSGGDNSKESSRDTEFYNRCGSGGIYTVPEVGYKVFVFFLHGDFRHPVYFASNPSESDWLTQKMVAKDRINAKLEQIKDFKDKFTPVEGVDATEGDSWADGARVNSRMGIEGEGEGVPYALDGETPEPGLNSEEDGDGMFPMGTGNQTVYSPNSRVFSNEDKNGEEFSRQADRDPIERVRGNTVGLDVKPLLDKEAVEGQINRSDAPHQYTEELDPLGGTDGEGEYQEENDLHYINRHITTMTTKGGTTIIIDNRTGEENFYLIHKNYLFNVDENGSAKEFCGQNTNEGGSREPDYNGETEEDGLKQDTEDFIRADKEVGVTGNYKIHALGNFVTYTKGNAFMQVDSNMQIDVNNSYGLRVRKGDVDIVIDGSDDDTRDDPDGYVEEGKENQQGDLNVSVKNGHIEVYCKENANVHVGDQCNLRVGGDMKVHVEKAYHLYVEGDYNEFIKGDRYTTVKGKVERRYSKNVKEEYRMNLNQEVRQNADLFVRSGKRRIKGDVVVHRGNVYCKKDLFVKRKICAPSAKVRFKAVEVRRGLKVKGQARIKRVVKCKNVITKRAKFNKHKHKVQNITLNKTRKKFFNRLHKTRIKGKRVVKGGSKVQALTNVTVDPNAKTNPPIRDGSPPQVRFGGPCRFPSIDGPDRGRNQGAGRQVRGVRESDSPSFRNTDGPPSNENSNNRTKPAKRRHTNRQKRESSEPWEDVPRTDS